jgi:hypothetical protein
MSSRTSDYLPSSLLRADSYRSLDGRNEDLSVSNPTRFRRFDDRFDSVVCLFITDNHFNLNLRKEVHKTIALMTISGLALSTAKPLYLAHCHSSDAHSLQRLPDFVEFERLNDGFYLFHTSPPAVAWNAQAISPNPHRDNFTPSDATSHKRFC